jgi:hypothetical protein
MEPEVSLLCSQEPTNGPYPEPDESRPHPTSLKPTQIFSCHLRLGLPRGTNYIGIYFQKLNVTYYNRDANQMLEKH